MDTIYNDILDTYFKDNMLKYHVFKLNDKIIREGYLKTYKQLNYSLVFFLKNKKSDNDDFDVPVPFNIIKHQSMIAFDYKIVTFSRNNNKIVESINNCIKNKKCSKYLDKILYINCIERT